MNSAIQNPQTPVAPPPPAAPLPEVPTRTVAAAEAASVAAPPKRRGRTKKTADPVPPAADGVVSESVAPSVPAEAAATGGETVPFALAGNASFNPDDLFVADPNKLIDHPSAGAIRKQDEAEFARLVEDMAERGYRKEFPILVLPDRHTVLDGRARRDAAVENAVKAVPCRVVEVGDAFDYMARAALLTRRMSDERWGLLAHEWMQKRSEFLKLQRAQGAAAASHGGLSVKTTDKQHREKLDARQEAAELFGVPVNLLKQIRRIEQEAPGKLPEIQGGSLHVSDVIKTLEKNADEKQRTELLKKAKALPVLDEWQHQDFQTLARSLEAQSVRAAILDNGNEQNVNDALQALDAAMMNDCNVLVFSGWQEEPGLRSVLQERGYALQGRIILWPQDVSGGSHGPVGEEMSVLWAVRGKTELAGDDGYRIPRVFAYHADDYSKDGDDMPLHPLQALVQVAALPNERIVAPFGRCGNIVIAARHRGRSIIAIQENEDLYAKGKVKIDAAFDGRQRFDQQISEAVAKEQQLAADANAAAPAPEIDAESTPTSTAEESAVAEVGV